jgi:hypothetical protein
MCYTEIQYLIMSKKDSHKKPAELAIEPLVAPAPNYPELVQAVLKSIDAAIQQSRRQDLPVIV